MTLQILALSCLFSIASCQLICYDCDPTITTKCLSPDTNNVKGTNCEDANQLQTTVSGSNGGPVEFECFTLYVEDSASENKTGIYRGCTGKKVGEKSCDNLKKEFGGTTACESCLTNNCNTVNIDAKGGPNGGSMISLSAAILFMALLSRILCC